VDKIRAVSDQIDSVKATMVKNLGKDLSKFGNMEMLSHKLTFLLIDKVIERGEKIEELVDKTEVLNYQANSFKVKSTQLKKHYRCKNQKITIIFVVFLLVSFFFVQKYSAFTSKI